MNNKKIWVDLDEILAELVDFVLEYNDYKIWEFPLKKEDIKDYYIHRHPEFNLSPEEAISWFRKPMYEDIWNYKVAVIDWAKEKLEELKRNWYILYVLTARIEKLFWEYTKNWLNFHFPDIFEEVIFTDHFSENHREKWDVAREYWIEFMIEDNYDYALELAEKWIKTYVLEKPWNSHRTENHENIIKIKSWEEFMK